MGKETEEKDIFWEERILLYVVICDDDINDLNRVIEILSDIFVQNEIDYDLKTFQSPLDLLKKMNQADIAILDISMGCMNGIDLGKKLKTEFPEVKIIYTTSYEEYCLQVINEIHAFSFLCKPVQKSDMERQILDLLKRPKSVDDTEMNFYKVSNLKGDEFPVLKLRLKDILCFEYVKSKRRITMVLDNKEYEISYVMKNLITKLERYGFAVNCRGNLVNLRHIVKIKGYDIYLDNGKILALSQKRAVEFKEKLNLFLHNQN